MIKSTAAQEPGMDYETVLNAMSEFFEGQFFEVGKVVSKEKIKGTEEDPFKIFNKVYVEQDGGGFSGDDFHGTVYFHIGNDRFATASY
jgi:hypothetical protein